MQTLPCKPVLRRIIVDTQLQLLIWSKRKLLGKDKEKKRKISGLHLKSHTPEGGNLFCHSGRLKCASHPRILLKQTTPFNVLCLCS